MGDSIKKDKMELQVFMSSERSSYSAVGIFDGDGITVLKGSAVSARVRIAQLDAEKRKQLLTEDMLLIRDIHFPTPDAAAIFVSGRAASGWLEWRTETGEPLNHVKEQLNQSAMETKLPPKIPAMHEADISQDLTQWSKQELRGRKRLLSRIKRDFEKKFFIGDIVISDQDYALLIKEARQLLAGMMQNGAALADSVSLAVTLVQIGIRRYDGKYWPCVEEELGVDHHYKHQQFLGESFINTLRAHSKYITDASERVQNILFHGFVSNYYSKGLFELLFQYYVKDLERDIYRNTTEQMQTLMDTLAKKATQDEKQSEAFTDQFMEKGSRAYKLRSHTLQAISAHPIHSRTRLRRLLRLIDRAFWKNDVPKNPSSRLTILFKEWVNDSSAFKKEYRMYQLGEIRNRGKKHFSTPYLFAHIGAGSFELKLPAQIVAEEYAEDLEWEITTNVRTFRLDTYTYPVLTGFKTEDGKTTISQRELFGVIQCQLVWNDQTVRKFPHLPESTVRFFDMEGDYASRLFRVPMCAYTPVGNTLHSGALLSKVPHGSMTRWDFEFQQGDLVVLPDGTGMIVGDHYTEGLVPRGQVLNTEYHTEGGNVVPVYSSAPELLLTIPKSKLAGTVLYCNDIRYRLTDCCFTEFENRDARGMQAVLLPLEQFDFCNNNGVKTIVLDAPGTYYDKTYSFVLVKGFSADFPGAPYVFEERGAVLFPDHIKVRGAYEKLQGENGFQFALNGQETQLKVMADESIPLAIRIPVLSWSADKETWNVLPAGELWHTEFFDIRKLYLRSPVNKITVFTNADIDDDDDEGHTITAESGSDGICTADMTRFRSWLTRDVAKGDILLKMGGVEYTFATVYTKSLVASYDVSADYEEGILTWISDIIGKAEYYLDIIHLETGAVLAEKAQITDGKLVIRDRLRTGLYKFTLYEAEEDNSGFDDPIYEELLYTERQLTNRNDVSGQFLEIRSFKLAHNSNLYTNLQKKYYVADFEKIEKDLYEGRLLANGVDTGLKVTIDFLKPGDLRFFHLTAWHEEEECDVDLLYDREQGSLELDQLPGLRSSESYRRYREISYGEFVYFGILHEELPGTKKIVVNPYFTIPIPESTQYSGKKALTIAQMGLSARTCNALIRYNIRYAGDIQIVKPEQWAKIQKLGRRGLKEVVDIMKHLELEMQMPLDRSEIPKTSIAKEVECNTDQFVASMHADPKIKTPDHEPAQEHEDGKQVHARKTPLSELGLQQNVHFALLQRGVETAGDIADLTPFVWKQMKQLKQSDIATISAKMKEMGLRIKK